MRCVSVFDRQNWRSETGVHPWQERLEKWDGCLSLAGKLEKWQCPFSVIIMEISEAPTLLLKEIKWILGERQFDWNKCEAVILWMEWGIDLCLVLWMIDSLLVWFQFHRDAESHTKQAFKCCGNHGPGETDLQNWFENPFSFSRAAAQHRPKFPVRQISFWLLWPRGGYIHGPILFKLETYDN